MFWNVYDAIQFSLAAIGRDLPEELQKHFENKAAFIKCSLDLYIPVFVPNDVNVGNHAHVEERRYDLEDWYANEEKHVEFIVLVNQDVLLPVLWQVDILEKFFQLLAERLTAI